MRSDRKHGTCINWDVRYIPWMFSWFCFWSGLVSIQLGFNRSRSLSLCFFNFFFLCRPLTSRCSVHVGPLAWGGLGQRWGEAGGSGGGGGSAFGGLGSPEACRPGVCLGGRPVGLPWTWLLVLSNSVLVCTPVLPGSPAAPRDLAGPQASPVDGERRGSTWSATLCFLGV